MPERDVVSWNSMISGYVSNGFGECGLEVFRRMQSEGVRPSGFTFSILVSCVECGRRGKEIHGNMVRSGVDLGNVVVGNSLIDMYGKLELLDYAFGVFLCMEELDVISWNSLLSGCCKSGQEELALSHFSTLRERFSLDEFTISTVSTACSNLQDLEIGLLERGPPPDHVTMTGVLSACNYGGFVDEGRSIFALMENQYGVKPVSEHYVCIVDMLSRAERILELEPQSLLPYMVLAKAYERRGRWESLVRVKIVMEKSRSKEMVGVSSVGIRNRVYLFRENQLLHCGGKDIYSTLRLLAEDMEHSEKTGT
ncbi:hypothetical protein POM88_037316 [Heracleum sosnowskyi]|uniref:Pentatricopeptide repeat-containing protein n=1 Tax=Heracleum sosnowskyi TaxID=360622 RepID=A0AAD8MFT7_9APIA|nr:hypothetical protein POM88_037316 [Heracleum sosnowskyi]